jgi:hypothetical protein
MGEVEGFLIEIEVNGDGRGISPPAGIEIKVNGGDAEVPPLKSR